MAKILQISQGQSAIVDDKDFDALSKYRWSYNAYTGYAVRNGREGEPRTVHMHRSVMDAPIGMQVDHVNGNKLDNRRENLRFANAQKNAFNRKKSHGVYSSKFKGVTKRKDRSYWEAQIQYNGKLIRLGRFLNEEEAACAYDKAALMLFGEFARVNFPRKAEAGMRVRNKKPSMSLSAP